MTNSREFSRSDVQIEANVLGEGIEISAAKVLNLSLNGVLVDCEAQPALGTSCEVRLLFGDIKDKMSIVATGRIIRADSQGLGLVFDEVQGTDGFHHLRQLVLLNSKEPDTVQEEFDEHLGIKKPY